MKKYSVSEFHEVNSYTGDFLPHTDPNHVNTKVNLINPNPKFNPNLEPEPPSTVAAKS